MENRRLRATFSEKSPNSKGRGVRVKSITSLPPLKHQRATTNAAARITAKKVEVDNFVGHKKNQKASSKIHINHEENDISAISRTEGLSNITQYGVDKTCDDSVDDSSRIMTLESTNNMKKAVTPVAEKLNPTSHVDDSMSTNLKSLDNAKENNRQTFKDKMHSFYHDALNHFERNDLEDLNRDSLLARFDRDNNGMIDYEEFAVYVKEVINLPETNIYNPMERHLIRLIKRDTIGETSLEKALLNLFTKFDDNLSGKITHEEFFVGLRDIGVLHSNFEVHGQKKKFSKRSLGLFTPKNKFRYCIVWLIEWKWFERFILFAIIVNTFILAIKDYQDPGDIPDLTGKYNRNWRNALVEESEIYFNIIFGVECFLKVLAMGFFVDSGTYLRDIWNCLDFVVVLAGFVSFLPNVPNVTLVRAIRVLRPLRTVSRLPGMRLLVTALLSSIPALLNVIILLIFIFAVFGILGVLFWNGKLHYQCRITHKPTMDGVWKSSMDGRICGSYYKCPHNQTCGSYHNPPAGSFVNLSTEAFPSSINSMYTNFDNLGYATFTIFQCITMEGWSQIMYQVQDSHNWLFASIYFISLIVVGSFFLLNLIFAVIWDKFKTSHDTRSEEWETVLKKLQRNSSPIVETINEHTKFCSHDKSSKPIPMKNRSFRKGVVSKFKLIVKSQWFEHVILVCIILNTVCLSMDEYPEIPSKVRVLEKINIFLTVIFSMEMFMKLACFGIKTYASDAFNIFDGIVVCLSIMELVISIASSGVHNDNSSISALRTFRLFRVFKLARSWSSLRNLLITIAKSLSDVANFGLLLLLIIYIFALVGMQFFANQFHFDKNGKVVNWEPHKYNSTMPLHAPWTPENPYIVRRSNFDDFFSSFVCVFQILTGEDWHLIMYDGIKSIGWGGAIFFIVLILIGNLIVLNLFLAILLGNFTSESIGTSDSKKSNKIIAVLKDLSSSITKSIPNLLKQKKSVSPMKASTLQQSFRRENTTLFIFAEDNEIRGFVEKLINTKAFEHAILFLIFSSSICLAIDNPLLDPSSTTAVAVDYFDIIVTACFSLEMILKIIGNGFLHNGKSSYMRDPWNILDFGIILISCFGHFTKRSNLKSLRSLRSLRALRPLRLISRAQGMKRVVNSLVSSIPSILNVTLVCSLFFLVFSILGTSQFKGKFFYCDMTSISDEIIAKLEKEFGFTSLSFKKLMSMQDCLDNKGQWKQYNSHFDNVVKGTMTLFEMSTTENWVTIMNMGIDATKIGYHPVENWNREYAVFFILFILVGGFFAMNLFVGAVIDNFNRMRHSVGHNFLISETQREWIRIQDIVRRAKLQPKIRCSANPFGKFCFRVYSNPYFEMSVAISIVLNTICLGMYSYNQSAKMTRFLETVNYIFWFLFLLEAGIKISLLKVRFLYNAWNIFDLSVVMGSSISYVLPLFINTSSNISSLGNAARAFRMGLAVRLLKRAKTMQVLFDTIIHNLPALLNVSALMSLMLFVYSIMGIQLFAGVILQEELNVHANFKDFNHAFVTLFRFTTGEAWNSVMYDLLVDNDTSPCLHEYTYDQLRTMRELSGDPDLTIGCTPGTAITYVYFVSFTIITTFVMLNLFVAVILENFDNSSEKQDAILSNEDFIQFTRLWQQYDPDATHYLNDHQLLKFLAELNPPMGLAKNATKKKLIAFAVSLKLTVSSTHHVYFADVCLAITQHIFRVVASERGEKWNLYPFLLLLHLLIYIQNVNHMLKDLPKQLTQKQMDLGIERKYLLEEIFAVKKIQSLYRQRHAAQRVQKLKQRKQC